jgi:iron complex transport system substrate-binding protein
MRTRLTSALGAAALASLLLAACGGAQDQDAQRQDQAGTAAGAADPELPAGWQYVAGEADFDALTADPALPVTVTDGTGTEVEVTDVSRIIVAGDGIASTLGALGLADHIHAAPEESTSPEGLAAPEHFRFNRDTGTEGLLAMDGTLFIGDNTARHGDVAQQFRDAGTAAVVVDDQQSQLDKLRAVAEYIGDAAAGEELVAAVEADLQEARDIAAASQGEDLRVIQVTATGAGGQNSVAGTGVPGTELIEELGYTSVGVESGLRGFSREFSNEGILAAEPDLILLAESDYERWGGEDGLWEAFPTLQQTPAGEEHRVFVMPDAQLRYSSPDLGAGAKALAEAVAQLS